MLAAFKTHFETGNDDEEELLGEDEEPTSYEEEQSDFEAH